MVAAPGSSALPLVLARHGGRRRAGRRVPGSGLGGDRGGPATMDRPRHAADPGRGDHLRQRVGVLHRRAHHLCRGGRRRRVRSPHHAPTLVDARTVWTASMSTLVAIALLLGVLAYAVFGGADFGAGFWDLTAGGAERGRVPAPRSTTRSARSGRSTTPG